jgi:peptide deformylase
LSIRMVVRHPNAVLREKAKPVPNITPNVLKLLDDMAETMYDAEGVGLAAPQVGILKRVVVVDCGEGLIELINPEIIEKDGEQFGSEGCLSIPGLTGEVKRFEKVTVKALDRNGQEVCVTGERLLARAFQHEVDHLNGVLFIDLAEKLYNNEGNPIK